MAFGQACESRSLNMPTNSVQVDKRMDLKHDTTLFTKGHKDTGDHISAEVKPEQL